MLPVGISFYTFQTLSYSIDVYRNKLEPTKSMLNFFTYVAFFPQLVAGPIERAINLLPQIENKRLFDYVKAKSGMRQILWGLFKKVAIADSCAAFVDPIFADYTNFSSIGLILGAVFFAIQIYCDFSGYSDIAIGVSKLLGIDLMQNFSFPYFSRDIAEFWRRWHISLSTWFRDYVYIPLGGSKVSKILQLRNIFVIFLVSGFWHGANWTFVFWGFLHALCYIPLIFLKRNRKNLDVIAQNKIFPNFVEVIQVFRMFVIVTFAWVFFRANNIQEGFGYLEHMFKNMFFDNSFLNKVGLETENLYVVTFFIIVMFVFEWFNRAYSFGLYNMPKNKISRYVLYLFLCLTIIQYLSGKNEFIYFQF
ncbi:MBOAT family O-acyltransferase [Xanthomarina sp. F2636L]|uniref:MBOAT family O-acyltransferase n=1 Tax=Xanthomarina sp. F2636L TaxID=2996018 RepID=UPI002B217489|nr:MBOAT family O-acyltransferase [Xanthomarina sp. F2636L]